MEYYICAGHDRCWIRESKNDQSLFIKHAENNITILLFYVDEIVNTWNNLESIRALKSYLHSKIEVKDLGLWCFLGIEVARLKQGTCLN